MGFPNAGSDVTIILHLQSQKGAEKGTEKDTKKLKKIKENLARKQEQLYRLAAHIES